MPEPAKQFFKSGFYCIQVLLGVNHFTSKGGWGGGGLGDTWRTPFFFPTPLCLFTRNFFFLGVSTCLHGIFYSFNTLEDFFLREQGEWG